MAISLKLQTALITWNTLSTQEKGKYALNEYDQETFDKIALCISIFRSTLANFEKRVVSTNSTKLFSIYMLSTPKSDYRSDTNFYFDWIQKFIHNVKSFSKILQTDPFTILETSESDLVKIKENLSEEETLALKNFWIDVLGTFRLDQFRWQEIKNYGVEDIRRFLAQEAPNCEAMSLEHSKKILPEDIGHFINLEHLYLSECNLSLLPTSLKNLTKLKTLHLGFNDITQMPILHYYPNLTSLYLGRNQITELPGLSSLIKLTRLELGINQIAELPGLSSLIKLEVLVLGENQITELPGLSSLSNLKVLSLGKNQIAQLPGLSSLIKLSQINFGKNKIESVPGLDSLIHLDSLYLGENKIESVLDLNSLTNLEILELGKNQIAELPDLSSLINLQVLELGTNQIAEAPGFPISLDYLDLGKNEIKTVPGLESLINLRELNLGKNLITKLPGLSILINHKLVTLSLGENQIAKLPLNSLKLFELDLGASQSAVLSEDIH